MDSNRNRGLLVVMSLLRKRRRLGYGAPGCPRRKRLLLVSSLLLLQQSRLARCKCGKKEKTARRWWQRPIFADHDEFGAWATLIPTLREHDEDMYYNFLRMTPSSFDKLLSLVSPFMKKLSWRKAISPGERLAITLRYLASGDSQTSLSFLFRVSNQAISKIVLETTVVIWHVLKKKVFPELTEELWLRVAAEFQVQWDLVHCTGAIDGKQVPVKAFPHAGSRFFGYKKRHCVTLMAVCDAKHRFLIIESGACGKRSDGNIFIKSTFARKLAKGQLNLPPPCPVEDIDGDMPSFFVGDNAYAKSQNLATPFKEVNQQPLRSEELVYNYRLSRGRRIIENAFGIMCARFRILFGPIEGSHCLVRHIILACIALHNFHLEDEESIPPKRRKYKPEHYADYIREDGKYIYGRWRNEKPAQEASVIRELKHHVSRSRDKRPVFSKNGKQLLEMLVRYFILKPVPWQWEKAHLL